MAFQTTRRVAFSETDAAGILHFARYLVWMEDCEHAFIRHLGTSVHTADADGMRLFPRVHAACDYRSPLRFEDEVTLTIEVVRRGRSSVSYRTTFHRHGDAEPCAVGTTVAVCARATGDGMSSSPLPADLAAALDAHLVASETR